APSRKEPTSHEATGPNQVWCWDITYLPTRVRGLYFYLYLILDLYSRKIVGWEVQATETGEHAASLLRRTILGEAVQPWREPLVLHADNGSPMKSATLLSTLQWLGVTPSHSRPRVSNDNAYAESVFRTCKYRPEYPTEGFATLEEARAWVMRFVGWYNCEHRHSGLNFVTPEQRHSAQAEDIMKRRTEIYEAARARNPQRWSRSIRDWSLPQSVWLNPEKSASPQAQAA
ncbi:MAG: IS3 family transposase, partial [Gammaproteobacteria bacterium]|nr:IS3 family transposase [Gammaproteobacteria bacterium]